MISFPNCKINLGLHILNKREDGFHNLETVFFPVPLKDSLEIITNNNQHTNSDKVIFSQSGINIYGKPENNLCIKAAQLLQKAFDIPAVKIHLHKTIPIGAGLGGGSADAAFTLKLLNDKYQLNLSTNQLINYSLQLGSDCPFFIINKPCFAGSRGELLEEISVNLSGYQLVLVNPGIHVNTGWAFSKITPALPMQSIKDIITRPPTSWKGELLNDFETAVFANYPAIKSVKDNLYSQNALYASMSGSGSTVFGIFSKEQHVNLDFANGYFTYKTYI